MLLAITCVSAIGNLCLGVKILIFLLSETVAMQTKSEEVLYLPAVY